MWALIVDGAVHEVTEIDPAGRFHSSLTWVGCDAGVAPGDSCDGGAFEPPPVAETADTERAWRDGEIAAHEWLVSRHRAEVELQRDTTLTAEQYAELLQYLQALRDWPQSEVFPSSAQRPLTPLWIAEQSQ